MTKNLHDISRAINLDLLDPASSKALQQAWCREACWPGCIGGYPDNREDNPSYGNCLVSVLTAYAARGMKDNLIPGIVDGINWHFRLSPTDSKEKIQIDPTWQQFNEGAFFRALTPRTEEFITVMKGSLIEDQSLVPRLGIIIERMKTLGDYDLGIAAEAIVENVREKYNGILGFTDSVPQYPAKLPHENDLYSPISGL